jgi:hypothetical protein
VAASATSPFDDAATFSQVLASERAFLAARRQSAVLDSSPVGEVLAAAPTAGPAASARSARESLEDLEIVGLALSGTGVRSAVLGLGLLQGLADLGLLRRLDYLSTVAGGAHIGSWLAAWIKREGDVGSVERQMRSSPAASLAPGASAAEGPASAEEPAPIRHLRTYSGTVAGHFDPLALDSWVLLAIRVRDLLLSQLVVVLALLAVPLAVRALVLLYHPAYRLTGWAVPVLLLGTYAVFRAAATLTGRAVRTRPTPARAIFRRLLVYLAVSLLYGPYFLLITLDFLRQRHWVVGPLGALAIGPPSLSVGALGVAVGALAGAGFGYRMDVRQGRRLREGRFPRNLVAALCGGAMLGGLYGVLAGVLLAAAEPLVAPTLGQGPRALVNVATLWVPATLIIWLLFFPLMFAVQDWQAPREFREEWATLTALNFVAALGWAAVFALVLWGPLLVLILAARGPGLVVLLGVAGRTRRGPLGRGRPR